MLRIQDLAETLQTSTMPVREALARLVSEQALEALPNRSVRVPVITRERLDDLARARMPDRGRDDVALALPNLSAADFARLRQLTARMRGGLPQRATTDIAPRHIGAEPRLPLSTSTAPRARRC